MTKQLPVTQCQYCCGTDIGMGWQHGEVLETLQPSSENIIQDASATACNT